MTVMTQTTERALGGVTGVVLAIALILAASPFINWLNGYGFGWIF